LPPLTLQFSGIYLTAPTRSGWEVGNWEVGNWEWVRDSPRLAAHIAGIGGHRRHGRLCHQLVGRGGRRAGLAIILDAAETRLGHVRVPAQDAVLLLLEVRLARLRRQGHGLAVISVRHVVQDLQRGLRVLLPAGRKNQD